MAQYNFNTTPERSDLMSRIKGKNTKPEIILRKSLWACGIRYRLNVSKLPGKPDIVIAKKKLVIFVDGEFWHGYKWEEKKPKIKNNREYWISKIERNIQRDVDNLDRLNNMGYTVLRFWEHEISKDLSNCLSIIKAII
jgi:DNA mismatch endonuclease (patch repair protein)